MHKGHLLRFFSLVLIFAFSYFFITPTHATSNPFSNFALTAGKSTNLGIPEGKEDLFYHNNIMFYAWCPDGSDGGSNTCEPVTGDQITWIGDSYSCGAKNEIEKQLPGVDIGTGTCGPRDNNIQGSKHFATSVEDDGEAGGGWSGLKIAQKLKDENKIRSYLVFALGTNDPGGTKNSVKEEIKQLIDIVGNDTKIVLTTLHVAASGYDYSNRNSAYKEAANEYDNIYLADWDAIAQDSYYQGDSMKVHPISAYDKWVQTIVDILPNNCGINIVSGGKTPEEKTWIGFRRLEYTPIQIAGIMGNIANEGGFNPISWQQSHESNWKPLRTLASNSGNQTGMGIVGFTYYTHLANLASIMEAKAPDLIDVLENPNKYYKPNGTYLSATQTMEELKKEFGDTRGEEIFDILLSIQILYIDYSVKDTASLDGIDWSAPSFHQNYIEYAEENLESPSSAALRWEWFYERHDGGTQPARQTDAERFYNDFKDLEVSSLSGGINSSSSSSTYSSSSSSITNSDGTANYDSIMHAKNADKSFFNGQPPELSAAWNDNDTDSMKRLLENYGDLAYQLGRVVNIPYVAVLTQMRYEDSQSVCGKNNFWGNGCDSSHATTGGATIQGENLGEGFSQYAQTLTNGLYDNALGLQDPKQYLETIGPMWVQGSASGAGYGSIEAMKSSIDKLQAYIDSDEGQAIVKTFGNYHENSSSWVNECDNDNNKTKCTSSSAKIAEKAVELAWPNEQGQCETSTGTKIQYVGSANSDCDTTPKPAYKEAFQKYSMSGDMKDCGHFAATVIRASEVDSDFPKSGTSNMISYMEGDGKSKWERIQEAESDETKLKPGDLLINSTHVEIYVGDYGGSWGVIADASQGERVGEIGYYGKTVNGISDYKVFRIKGGNNCGEGGLTEEQAQKLADNYNNNVEGWQGKVAQGANYVNTACGSHCNCVLFSAFFTEMFTDIGLGHGWPNGGDMADSVAGYGFDTGTEPRPYAVFSTANHTGVVVSVKDGSVTTIEAGYVGYDSSFGATVFTNKNTSGFKFTYLDTNNKLDTNKIIRYIGQS